MQPVINKSLNIKNIGAPYKAGMLSLLPGVKKLSGRSISSFEPMLVTLADSAFDSKDWIYEIKWDGYRAIAVIEDNSTSIYSRNNILLNKKFTPIVQALEKLELGNSTLDGEIVAVDSQGKSSFLLLQQYLKTGKGAPVYYVFDILVLDGYDLRGLALYKRKEILEQIFKHYGLKIGTIPGNIMISGFIKEKGIDFFNIARKNNLEGIIAKRIQSVYETGKRSKNWLKIKIRQTQDAVICGYIENDNGEGYLKSLVTGVYRNRRLVFSGLVGSGFDKNEKERLIRLLTGIKTAKPPFKAVPELKSRVVWVKPVYVIKVEYTEWTGDFLFRHPSYIGLKYGKSAGQAVLEKEIIITDHKEYEISITEKNSLPDKTGNPEKQVNKIEKKIDEGKKSDNKSVIELVNPEKIFWPGENIKKKDLFEYYKKIAPYILPYITGRLQSLNRCPDGIHGQCFYQKDIDYALPKGLETRKIYSEARKEMIDYLICTGTDSLLYMVNLGCIDIHPWSSRFESLRKPDFAVLDLDPIDVSFQEVVAVSLNVKDVLDGLGIEGFCKTSGSKGIHIYIPMGAAYSYDQALDFIKLIALAVNKNMPDITSLERNPGKRHGKVYLDCYQNKFGATVAAPYCLRPRQGATVSTPLFWEELNKSISPGDFNIWNIFERLDKTGDIWKGVIGPPVDILSTIENLRKYFK